MVFWVTRATEDFVCNTFRAMTMANFHLTKKPTLQGYEQLEEAAAEQ